MKIVLDNTLTQKALPPEFLLPTYITIPEGTHRHQNYLGYLDLAYAAHRGIIVSPCTIWYTVLAELAGHVKTNSEHYRSLFTSAKGSDKTTIEVYGLIEDVVPDDFITSLRKLVPLDVNLLLPKFTVATDAYNVASGAAFCDMASPYYNYMMYCCGIPSVTIEGTEEDWQTLLTCFNALSTKFDKAGDWFQRVTPILVQILNTVSGETEPDLKFWKNIFYDVRCGSGGQTEIKGWITDFFMEYPGYALLENFPSHISKFEVTQKETQEVVSFQAGLFYSRDVDGVLIPEFAFGREHIKPVPAKRSYY